MGVTSVMVQHRTDSRVRSGVIEADPSISLCPASQGPFPCPRRLATATMFKRGKGRNSLGLIDASQNGDLARVKAKLKAGCDVNSRDEVRNARHRLRRALAARQRGRRGWRRTRVAVACFLLPAAVVGARALLASAPPCGACVLTSPPRVPLTRCTTAALSSRSGSSPLSCGRRTKGI